MKQEISEAFQIAGTAITAGGAIAGFMASSWCVPAFAAGVAIAFLPNAVEAIRDAREDRRNMRKVAAALKKTP